MGRLRPEDLVEKPSRSAKGSDKPEKEEKKIPPKLILIGGGVAVLILCVVMMTSSPKKPPQSPEAKNAAIEKGKAEIAAAQEKKAPRADVPAALPATPEKNAQIDAEVAKADATLKSIAQQVSAIDVELHDYSQASERLGQLGDREGKRDADRNVAALTQKRKEMEQAHAKWTSYRSELLEQKNAVAGAK